MFVAGLALPVLAVALLYVGRAEQSAAPPLAPEVAASPIGPPDAPAAEPEATPIDKAPPNRRLRSSRDLC